MRCRSTSATMCCGACLQTRLFLPLLIGSCRSIHGQTSYTVTAISIPLFIYLPCYPCVLRPRDSSLPLSSLASYCRRSAWDASLFFSYPVNPRPLVFLSLSLSLFLFIRFPCFVAINIRRDVIFNLAPRRVNVCSFQVVMESALNGCEIYIESLPIW